MDVMAQLSSLEDWYPGMKTLRAADQNAVYAFLRRLMGNIPAHGHAGAIVGSDIIGVMGPPSQPREWLGEIQEEGPDSEPDYTDARYWVRRVYVDNYTQDATLPLTYSLWDLDSPYHEWVTAHNLAELQTGSHQLQVGDLVQIKEILDRARPRKRRFVFHAVVPQSLPEVVTVSCDGGGPGDHTQQCDFTYAIYSLAGAELATGCTPAKARASRGPYRAAGTGTYGLAVQIDDTYQLLIAYDEVEAIYLCDCSGDG